MRAGDVTLHDLGARFGLQLTKDAAFFLEWHAELPEISEQEKQQLDRIQASYLHLVSQTSMVEDVVKMVVLSPLLYLADFFLPPLSIQSEVAVQLSIAYEELAIERRIDIPGVAQSTVDPAHRIETGSGLDRVGLTAAGVYACQLTRVTNLWHDHQWREFVFLKLVQGQCRVCAVRIFEMRNQE
jgi:hypothetical protein